MPTLTTSNSYATLEEATEYCDNRLGASAWEDADEDDQIRALIDATRDLKLFSYTEEIDEEDVPQWMIDAVSELAFNYIVAGAPTLAKADNDRGVIRKKVDVLETEWESGDSRPEFLSDRYPRVYGMIAPYLSDEPFKVIRS